MRAEDLENTCVTQRPHGIYLMPSGTNPTNIAMSETRKTQIADIVRRYEIVVIEDDNYSALFDERPVPLAHYVPDQSVFISGFSKPVCSGFRIVRDCINSYDCKARKVVV